MRVLMIMLLSALCGQVTAMSLALAKVERAAEGETEEQVCDRAMQLMTEELHASLLSVIAATEDYQQRRRAYRSQDRPESLLRDAYLSMLQKETPSLQGQRWSGSRCTLRARYEADIDALAQRVPIPEASPANRPNQQDAPPPGIDPKTWELFSSSRDRSALAQAFSTVSVLRMQVSEYYLASGEWPGSLEAMGIAPEQVVSERIKRAYMLRDGMFKLELAGRLKGHELTTWPVEGGMHGLEWKCSTTVNMGGQGFCEQVD